MSKAFIAQVLQESADLTGTAANQAAGDLMDAVVKELKREGKFTLPSFGTFTVRKMSFGQGVERIFPYNSKVVDKIEKIRSYKVRRAKLFYIRGLRGKAARLKERV